jgi:isopenicillin N synthase-like dioxygenase
MRVEQERAMAADFKSIPVIDIASLESPDLAARRRVAEALGAAAREVGFLYVTGHGVPAPLSLGVREAAKRFFGQTPAQKMAAYIGRSTNHSGYVPEGEEVFDSGKIDKKESFDVNLDAPEAAGEAPMLGANLWPEVDGFQPAVAAYYAAVASLARRMFRGFSLALDLPEDHFEPHLTRPPSQLRLIHYPFDPPAPGEQGIDQEGIGAHTDYEFFTILQGTAPGLEVRNGAGEWIDAPPVPGAFVVNIGDMLEVWTNGVFRATVHRVRKVAEERYSFPFFAAADYRTVVEPAARFVTAERPAQFGRMVAGEHLWAQTVKTFRYLEPRRQALSA